MELVRGLATRAEVTVLTSLPELYRGIAHRTVRVPSWTGEYRLRVFWQLTLLHRHCTTANDVLICPVPAVPLLSPIPVVPVVHDITPLALHRWHGDQHKLLFWFSLQTIRRAAAVLTDSEHTRSDLRRLRLLPPARVHVAPLGIAVRDCGATSPVVAALKPFVLYVGCMYPHKNLVRLVSAFGRLKGNPQLRLVFAGTDIPQWVDRVRRAVAREGLDNRVVLLGEVSDAELSQLYRESEAFVFPSLYEGFGLPVLEAMANGAPVVCSSTSSVPEIAGDAAAYFDPLNTDDLARAIDLVLSHPALAMRMRQTGRLRAAGYSWKNTVEVAYRVIADVVSRRRPPAPTRPGS